MIGCEKMLHKELTGKIIRGFFKVYNTLGCGFLEKVYENALAFELGDMGLRVKQQSEIKVFYEGHSVGDYFADIIVEDTVILELKACRRLNEDHSAQLINYLAATEKEVGLLLNFGRTAEFKRLVFSNSRKTRRIE